MASDNNSSLEVNVIKDDERPILELNGSIGDADVKKFQKKIEQLFKKKSPKIIIDVSRASYIDSHGLGTIVYYHTLLQKDKRELIILNTNTDESSYLNKLFDLTNLNQVLNIVTKL